MSYKLTIKRLPNFLRYVNKVYRFSQTINSTQSKGDPETSPQTIFTSVFLCMLLRLGSLRQLAEDAKEGSLHNISLSRPFCCQLCSTHFSPAFLLFLLWLSPVPPSESRRAFELSSLWPERRTLPGDTFLHISCMQLTPLHTFSGAHRIPPA